MLEIMIVIAMISLLTGVLVTGGLHLTREGAASPEDTFWKAVTEARRIALLSGRDVRMRFAGDASKDGSGRALVLRTPEGSERRVAFETSPGELAVEFLPVSSGGTSILLAGQLIETTVLPQVVFYGDGTCSPFRVQIRTGGAPRTLAIDPWTCALVLPVAREGGAR